jgi:trimethylamine--corrinoid protein Co-methyltransferase
MRSTFEVLSSDERDQIHERTLHLLSTTGMRVDTDQGREILRSAGAEVDDASRIVHFPAPLIEDALAATPRALTLGARRPGWSHKTCVGSTTLCSSGEAPFARDRETGEIRMSTHDDYLQGLKLIDALDEVGVHWAFVSGFSEGDTLGDEVSYFATVQRGFSKHVQDSSDNVAAMPWQLEILDVVFGGRDEVRRLHPYSFLLTPVSPLVIEGGHVDACLALRGWDIPVGILPMPMTGTTAPGSLAATVLLANCEILGCMCLLQAAEPGTPVIYSPAMMTMNPRSGLWTGHAPHDLLSAAGTEMAHYYGLPSMASGCDSDHFELGMQAGYEKALSGLVPMLSRPDIIVGPGTLGSATVWSAEDTVIDCEIMRTCDRICRGIATDGGRLYDDVIERVGPGGNFLGEKTTRQSLRDQELFIPGLGWHETRDAWEAAGRPDLIDQARVRVGELLAAHETLALDANVERELDTLVERARAAAA